MIKVDFKTRVIEALHRIVVTIQSEGDLSTLLQTILEESKRILDSDASSLFLYDSEKQDLYFEVVAGGDQAIRSIRVPLGQGIVGSAAVQRKTQIVNDCRTDSRHLKVGEFVVHNLIAVPMVRNDRLIGVLEVLNKRDEQPFDDMDSKILEIMADQAAAQIEATRLMRAKLTAERLAALGTTAAGLAHYIKNVLGQWKGSSTLIDMGITRADLNLVAECWPLLKRSNDKIAKLVQDMLTISREREPELSDVDLNKMIRDILDECRAKAAEAMIGLEADLDPALPVTEVDASRLHDVLLNLVGNAVEAIEEARMDGSRVKVSSRFNPQTQRITIEVDDNGPGMSPEVQARVFEPFFSTKGSRGTGLGLAVAMKSIGEHGGSVKLRSQLGHGSTFTIEMPHRPPPTES